MENENSQTTTDLFYMINAQKELFNNLIDQSKSINSKNISIDKNYNYNVKDNYKFKDLKNNTNLETEVENLKISLTSFEENYGYVSPYHDDIINKLKEKKQSHNLTIEISQKIYELYQKKYYNDCYDLWSIFGFKPLLYLSPEENYEILRHLTKVRDDFCRRKNLLKNLENFNLFNDNNYNFETGISFKNIRTNKNPKTKTSFFNNNNSIYNESAIKNDIDININVSNNNNRTYNNEDIVKQKIDQNNLMLEELKRKVLNYSYN